MKTKSLLAGAALALLMPTAAHAGDVRIMWYSDGVEGDVMKDLVGRFMKENPGINVTLDNVAYSVIKDQLPVQARSRQRPGHRPRHRNQGPFQALARPAPAGQGRQVLGR